MLENLSEEQRKVMQYAGLFLVGSLLGGCLSYFYGTNSQKIIVAPTIPTESSMSKNEKLYVDVSGAVSKPGVYSLDSGSRIQDALRASGGLSKHASAIYISQNLNLSKKLKDGDKLYIPFVFDEETISSSAQSFNLLCTSSATSPKAPGFVQDGKIDANLATRDQLIALQGIGEVTADKIIAARPFEDIDDFYNRIKLATSVKTKLEDILVVN